MGKGRGYLARRNFDARIEIESFNLNHKPNDCGDRVFRHENDEIGKILIHLDSYF